jgi:hypothetical protein
MNDFLNTIGGRRFAASVESLSKGIGNISSLVKTLDKIEKELHEANRLKKIELGLDKSIDELAEEFITEREKQDEKSVG